MAPLRLSHAGTRTLAHVAGVAPCTLLGLVDLVVLLVLLASLATPLPTLAKWPNAPYTAP